MHTKTRLLLSTAVAGALLLGATLATGASAQTAPSPGMPGAGFYPGCGMMAGFGPAAATSAGTYGTMHDANRQRAWRYPQELWDARVAGKTVAELAAERKIPLQTVVDAAVAARFAQLQTAGAVGFGYGPGMMGGRGMTGGFGIGPGRFRTDRC